MVRIQNRRFEVFGDGILDICETEERSLIKTKIENVRFGDRTIGVSRFWNANTAGNKADRMVSVPLEICEKMFVGIQDIVNIKKGNLTGQYKIIQIQPKYDAKPPVLYLTLEKMMHPYKDMRTEDGKN